jgi:hypothetical protein
MVCPKFNSHVYKLKRWKPWEHISLYFATGVQTGASIWGHAQCSKKIADGPINMAPFLKKRKSCELTHDLISWSASQGFFGVLQQGNLSGLSLKFFLWRVPTIEGFILKYRVPPLWLTHTGERRTTFVKAHGVEVRCYGEHVEKQIGNPLGTWKEHSGNKLGTKDKWKKILPLSPAPLKLKREKSKAPWVYAWAFPLAAWNFSFQKSSSP